LSKNSYQVKDASGNIIHRKFSQNELLKVPENTTVNNNLNPRRVNELNNIKIGYNIPEPERIVTRGRNRNTD
jgi:hypothetical protein